MSVTSTIPLTYFGGTWVAWGSGRVPVGINTSDSNFNTVEKNRRCIGGYTDCQSDAKSYAYVHWKFYHDQQCRRSYAQYWS